MVHACRYNDLSDVSRHARLFRAFCLVSARLGIHISQSTIPMYHSKQRGMASLGQLARITNVILPSRRLWPCVLALLEYAKSNMHFESSLLALVCLLTASVYAAGNKKGYTSNWQTTNLLFKAMENATTWSLEERQRCGLGYSPRAGLPCAW